MNEKIIITGERTTQIPDGIKVIDVDTIDRETNIRDANCFC
jgi:hypothetical protein